MLACASSFLHAQVQGSDASMIGHVSTVLSTLSQSDLNYLTLCIALPQVRLSCERAGRPSSMRLGLSGPHVAIMPYYAGMSKLPSNANYSCGMKDISCIMSNGPLSAALLEPPTTLHSVVTNRSCCSGDHCNSGGWTVLKTTPTLQPLHCQFLVGSALTMTLEKRTSVAPTQRIHVPDH